MKKPTTIRIKQSTAATLMALRAVTGAPYSEIVRRAVELYAANKTELIDGYWRDHDAHQDAIDQAYMAHGG